MEQEVEGIGLDLYSSVFNPFIQVSHEQKQMTLEVQTVRHNFNSLMLTRNPDAAGDDGVEYELSP